MAGYDEYSKSNNALDAEADGRYPATKLAARIRRYFPGVTAADVKSAMRSREWHHTSCKYNTTDYFDLRDLAELATRQELRAAIAERISAAAGIGLYAAVYERAISAGLTHVLMLSEPLAAVAPEDFGRPWYRLREPRELRGWPSSRISAEIERVRRSMEYKTRGENR